MVEVSAPRRRDGAGPEKIVSRGGAAEAQSSQAARRLAAPSPEPDFGPDLAQFSRQPPGVSSDQRGGRATSSGLRRRRRWRWAERGGAGGSFGAPPPA